MKLNYLKFTNLVLVLLLIIPLIVLITTFITTPTKVFAATSPTLTDSSSYSVLRATTVTCTGGATITGDVGVYAGSDITGFPGSCTVSPGTLQATTQSAQDAQADNLIAFGALDQDCTTDYRGSGVKNLTSVSPLGPGVYCADSFTLTGNLTLSGSGVYIFKSTSSIVTSPNSSVTGSDACNVWWRVGSSATLDTATSFIGNILALTSIWMNTGASLNGRAMVQTGEVTLDGNNISGPTCVATPTPTPTPSSTSSSTSSSTDSSPCIASEIKYAPTIVESERISPTSIYLKWTQADEGLNSYIVQYGFEKDKWSYNTIVQGLSTTLGSLPPNQPIWAKVAATGICGVVGNYGEAKLLAGQIGQRSAVNPNVLGVSFPNAGFAPQ